MTLNSIFLAHIYTEQAYDETTMVSKLTKSGKGGKVSGKAEHTSETAPSSPPAARGRGRPPKGAKKGAAGKRTKKGAIKPINYSIYIYRVLKQVHPDIKISPRSMGIMNSMIRDIFDRITGEASRLVHFKKGETMDSRDIQTAVRLLLPGELAKHAISEGTKAVTKYMASKEEN